MKIFMLALAIVFSLPVLPVRAASQEEEARFVNTARTAFAKHDADALVAITCWDRVPDKLKDSGKRQYVRDVAQTATNITLINPDPQFPDLEWKDEAGVAYRSNLTVVKQLKITFASGEFSDGTYPVGEKDGKLYLLEPAPVNGGEALTNTTTKTVTQKTSMTYTLDIDGKKWPTVLNPTEADIRAAVASLRDDAEPGFLILRKDAGNMIQVTCVARDSFAIQSQEGDENHVHQASKNIPAEATIKLLLAYRNDNPDWKKLADWKPM